MKEQTPIRCQSCDASSEKTLIYVFKNKVKCHRCATIDGIMLDMKTLQVVSRDNMDRMMEGAHAVNTGAHEGMPREEK